MEEKVMEKFWMVWNPKRTSPTCQHKSIEAAVAEAERLARRDPGQEFYVLEALRMCQVPELPIKWTELEEPIPF
jgi:hypothetical protein